MKRILFFCLLACQLSLAAGAQDHSYEVGLIPKSLLAYANAVVRHQESTTQVKAADQVVYTYKEAITILNPQGAGYGQIAVFYDKARQIKNLKVAVYDRQGKLIKKTGAAGFQERPDIVRGQFLLAELPLQGEHDPVVLIRPADVERTFW